MYAIKRSDAPVGHYDAGPFKSHTEALTWMRDYLPSNEGFEIVYVKNDSVKYFTVKFTYADNSEARFDNATPDDMPMYFRNVKWDDIVSVSVELKS